MKRHLLRARGSTRALNRAACGMRAPPVFTADPVQVTCLACRRTLFMADYEFRLSRKAQRATRKEKRSSDE